MIPMLVMTFREGIESFLIVAVTLAYLRKTGRDALVPAAWWGAAAAFAASAGAGWLFAQAENQPVWEGTLALVAALLVGSMVVYMLRAAPHISGEIRARLDRHAAREGFAARLGVFAFVLLMITREGMELALIAGSLATQTGAGDMLAGALVKLGEFGFVSFDPDTPAPYDDGSGPAQFEAFVEFFRMMAALELGSVPDTDRSAQTEVTVVGTVAVEVAMAAIRRMALEDASHRRFVAGG